MVKFSSRSATFHVSCIVFKNRFYKYTNSFTLYLTKTFRYRYTYYTFLSDSKSKGQMFKKCKLRRKAAFHRETIVRHAAFITRIQNSEPENSALKTPSIIKISL